MISPRTIYLLALAIITAAPLYVFADTAPADAFTPLTNLPGLSDALSSDTLPRFLNNLYRLCIGAVAVIAVLKIMQGGAELMFNRGSFSQATQAKKHIQNAVLGLLLVLSPAIVFSIVNPDILDLSLNVDELQTNYAPVTPVTYSNETQQRMCQSFEDFQGVPDRENTDRECLALGSGWAGTDNACCAAAGKNIAAGNLCCRYNREEDERLRPQPPPDAEDNETGAYRIEYVKAERDFNTGAQCVTEGTQRYNTKQECQAALSTLNGAAAIHTCTDGRTEAYAPSPQEYNRINALPPCS